MKGWQRNLIKKIHNVSWYLIFSSFFPILKNSFVLVCRYSLSLLSLRWCNLLDRFPPAHRHVESFQFFPLLCSIHHCCYAEREATATLSACHIFTQFPEPPPTCFLWWANMHACQLAMLCAMLLVARKRVEERKNCLWPANNYFSLSLARLTHLVECFGTRARARCVLCGNVSYRYIRYVPIYTYVRSL